MTETVPERITMGNPLTGETAEYVLATDLEAAQARIVELEGIRIRLLNEKISGQWREEAETTARREALEKAAKVAEVWVKRAMHLSPNGYEIERSHGHMAKAASNEIRALMEKPNG